MSSEDCQLMVSSVRTLCFPFVAHNRPPTKQRAACQHTADESDAILVLRLGMLCKIMPGWIPAIFQKCLSLSISAGFDCIRTAL